MLKWRRSNPNRPLQVNVTMGVTYEVDEVMLNDISEACDIPLAEITTRDVMAWLDDWITEDFQGGGMLTITDEKGRAINA